MQFASTSALQNINVANAFAAYLRKANQAARFVMLTTLIPFFFSLTSCSKMDTVAPVADQTQINGEAREAASVLGVEGFENGQLAKFWRTEFKSVASGQFTKEVRRAGKQAMRFSWTPSQVDGTNPSLHSELAMEALPVGDTERWYGYSAFMPSASMANDNQTVIVSQWHGHPDQGFEDSVPPMAISVEPGNKLQLVYRASNVAITKPLQHPTSQVIMDLGTAIFDQWVDYVVHVKWDPTGYTGQLQIWQNGVQIVNKQNIQIGYLQQRKPFWKIGLYAWTGKSVYSEKVIYYDEARIGDASASYEAVMPGRLENSARARTN